MARYNLKPNYSTKEILVFNSVGLFILQVFINILFLIFTFFVYKITTNYFLIFFLASGSIYLIFRNVLYFKSLKEVQLRINLRGVQFKNGEIVSWIYIENERVEIHKNGKSKVEFFVYYVKNKDSVIKLNLDKISIPGNDLINLFKYFKSKSIS